MEQDNEKPGETFLCIPESLNMGLRDARIIEYESLTTPINRQMIFLALRLYATFSTEKV